MAIVLTIKAVYDVTGLDDLEGIGDSIREGLEALRGQGAARVETAVADSAVTMFKFIQQVRGLSEIEFDLPQPTKARIEFD